MWCMPKCEYVELYDEHGEPYKVETDGPWNAREGRTFASGGANFAANTTYRIFDSESAVTNSTGRDIPEICPGRGVLVTGVARFGNRPVEAPTESELVQGGRTEIYYGSTNTEPIQQYSSVCDNWCNFCQVAANGVTGALVAAESFVIGGHSIENLVCWFNRPFLLTGDDRSRLMYEITPSISVTPRTNYSMFVMFFGYWLKGDCKPFYGNMGAKKDLTCDQVAANPTGSLRNQFVA